MERGSTANGIGSSAVGSFEKYAPPINFSHERKGGLGGGTARFDGLIFAHGGEVLWTDVNPFLDCPRMITDNHQPLLFGRHSASLDGERVNQSGVVLESEKGSSHGAKSEVGSCRSRGLWRAVAIQSPELQAYLMSRQRIPFSDVDLISYISDCKISYERLLV